ncbi:DMT family transporter [uncultured Demequina sp.]|uniref:DMT family transporter n=1 Tax=uncultured Demequina sp. TaxID=693499 RepID=UPI0025ECD7F2|nr:EamA family transporter [uncultured Demequina sp.]
MRTRDFVLVVVAAVLWGTGGALGSLLADNGAVPPASVAMWRMLIAGVVLTLWLLVRSGIGRLDRAMLIRILLTGALIALFEVLYFTGIELAGVGLATLVAIGSAPVWVAIWDAVRLREAPGATGVVALLIALAGLIALTGSSLNAGGSALAGVGVSLLTGAAFAAVTVSNRTPVPGLGAVRLTALSFSAGGLMLVPVAALSGWGVPEGIDGWGWALALGILATALAYVAYLSGLETVPPFVATIVALLEPLVAAVLGALVFAERLGWWGVVGGVALASAVVVLRPQRDEPVAVP